MGCTVLGCNPISVLSGSLVALLPSLHADARSMLMVLYGIPKAFAAGGRGVCSFADAVAPAQSAVVVTAGSLPVTVLNATVWKMGAILDEETT